MNFLNQVYRGLKGIKGSPGELEGDFLSRPRVIGDIKLNCDFGVFGNFNDTSNKKWGRPMQIGPHSMVHEGPAIILACIDGNEVKEYKIEIQKISRLDLNSTKNMVICITDERLLKSTGGIVQGMSGSPIIQDGRLVGAVTHVFINDPTRGYGVFIESMINKSNSLAKNKDRASKPFDCSSGAGGRTRQDRGRPLSCYSIFIAH